MTAPREGPPDPRRRLPAHARHRGVARGQPDGSPNEVVLLYGTSGPEAHPKDGLAVTAQAIDGSGSAGRPSTVWWTLTHLPGGTM